MKFEPIAAPTVSADLVGDPALAGILARPPLEGRTMTRTRTREPSQFVVHLIDLTQYGSLSQYGYVETRGGLFMLSRDGIGPDDAISDEFPVEVAEGQTLGPAALRELAAGETQPLHEFIRTFGDRLERNYETWEAALRAV